MIKVVCKNIKEITLCVLKGSLALTYIQIDTHNMKHSLYQTRASVTLLMQIAARTRRPMFAVVELITVWSRVLLTKHGLTLSNDVKHDIQTDASFADKHNKIAFTTTE